MNKTGMVNQRGGYFPRGAWLLFQCAGCSFSVLELTSDLSVQTGMMKSTPLLLQQQKEAYQTTPIISALSNVSAES